MNIFVNVNVSPPSYIILDDIGINIVFRLIVDKLNKLTDDSHLRLRDLLLDLIYCYKIVFGLTKLNFVDFFLIFHIAYQGACVQTFQAKK